MSFGFGKREATFVRKQEECHGTVREKQDCVVKKTVSLPEDEMGRREDYGLNGKIQLCRGKRKRS